MELVEISQAQGRVPVTVFTLKDRVNLGNFAQLEETAKNAYNDGMRDLVIDMSQTPSLTSIGIRALIIIHKMLSVDPGRHLKLAAPIPAIRDMLDIAGVTQYIEIYDTVQDAIYISSAHSTPPAFFPSHPIIERTESSGFCER
jgi:anti-anti-sigma factor